MTGNSEKAAHYLSLLDNARVNATWTELPELIRKVNKHAPQRSILVHTATAEHQVATGSTSGQDSAPLNTLSSTLRSEDTQDPESSFQGKTCLLWSRWLGLEGNSGTAGFDTASAVKSLEGQSISTWTKICIIKSTYIEGTTYLRNGRPTEAQKVFGTSFSSIQSNKELVLSTPQLAYWAEQLLAQCALGSQKRGATETISAAQMEAFRYWGIIASKTKEVSASTYRNSSAHLPRLSIWRKYYEYISMDLRLNTQDQAVTSSSNRVQLATEVRKVENAYENELLRTIRFPTANETNEVVERWVEQAIGNWQMLCGPQWRDKDLGEGGRNAIARKMLDVLYRAATKTFHSTLILRRLFQVHLSLSEFDLAYRAFDTYIELVDRGRERVAKSKKAEPGHESDEVVLLTVSEAITGLCRFGRQSEARKAYGLSLKLEGWLDSTGAEEGALNGDAPAQSGETEQPTVKTKINHHVLQQVYRAIGTGKAHWARWTPTSEDRTEMQDDALNSLREAYSQGDPDVETLYATSLLLAETRDIAGAVQMAKQALALNTAVQTHSPAWATERKLVSQWHLLALLLSSRQDFDSATKSCMAAFEQFASGQLSNGVGRNSSVSSNIEKQLNDAVSTFAAEMECDELQKIIEVRITELALTELVDGPEEAVNASNELLSLFSRLFAHLQVPLETPVASQNRVPPKSSAGTVKTARTSIFGRKKDDRQGTDLNEKGDDVASMATSTTRPSTRATQAPTIQVTNEDEKPSSKKHHIRKSYDSSRSKTTVGSATQRLSHRFSHHGHTDKSSSQKEQSNSNRPGTASTLTAPGQNLPDVEELSTPNIPLDHEKSATSKHALAEVGHNLDSHQKVPPPASHQEQPPQQDVRLPTVDSNTNATSPSPRFSKAIAQRQALAVLVKVWLVIATLYRRASMFEDSKEACQEADKAATRIEAIVGATDQSARSYAEAGWGAGNKSVDEVRADIYCEQAELQLAVHNRNIKDGNLTNNDDLRTAVEHYEQCLMFVPNHPAGVIGLSNILLDYYERKVDLGRRVTDSKLIPHDPDPVPSIIVTSDGTTAQPTNGTTPRLDSTAGQIDPLAANPSTSTFTKPDEDLKKTPENLNRIAARDRAYGLLSTLTKLGSGWDDSAAWFALARAHELGGEIEKAKSILWWCIELEETKPIRHWRNLGYTL